MQLSGPSGVKQGSVLLPFLIAVYVSVRKKHVQQLKKRKKSRFLDLKNVKKRTYSLTGHLITHPLILNYRKSVLVIFLRNADTINHAT